jgi:hypothetical protein
VDDIDLNPFRRRLRKRGEPADARVLEVDVPSNQSPGAFVTHRYVVEVQPAAAPPFQANVKDAFNVFWAPKRGDLLTVKFAAKSHKVAFDLDGDPRYDASMQKPTGQWSPGELRPPSIFGTAPPQPVAAATGGSTVADRLQELAQLRDGGLITADEYEAKRRVIVASL